MKKIDPPFKQYVFVCANSRAPGQRISCCGEGRCGEKILEYLKGYVKEKNLKNVVRVLKSGCQESCEKGPNIAIFPQNIFLSDVSMSDMDQIVKNHFEPFLNGVPNAS